MSNDVADVADVKNATSSFTGVYIPSKNPWSHEQ